MVNKEIEKAEIVPGKDKDTLVGTSVFHDKRYEFSYPIEKNKSESLKELLKVNNNPKDTLRQQYKISIYGDIANYIVNGNDTHVKVSDDQSGLGRLEDQFRHVQNIYYDRSKSYIDKIGLEIKTDIDDPTTNKDYTIEWYNVPKVKNGEFCSPEYIKKYGDICKQFDTYTFGPKWIDFYNSKPTRAISYFKDLFGIDPIKGE